MKHILLLLTLVLTNISSFAQIFVVEDPMLDTLFNARVKSLDEFIERFNGDKISSDIAQDDPLKREKNILSLFERDSLAVHQAQYGNNNDLFLSITDFIKYVAKNNIKLDLQKDSMLFAVASLKMKYAAKDKNIKMALRYEHIGNDIYGWKIAGVSGLVENGIIDTSSVRIFRPVDNEMNFSTIVPTINAQNNHITQYRSFGFDIDPTSYFLALCATNKISGVKCESVVYHVLSIDGYAFEISKFDRLDKNNGWLISKFKTMDKPEKIKYINKLLGKNEK